MSFSEVNDVLLSFVPSFSSIGGGSDRFIRFKGGDDASSRSFSEIYESYNMSHHNESY